MLSWDGGETWETRHTTSQRRATEIEEWEFHSSGVHDLFVLNVRFQSADGPDVDVAYHVREFSQSLEPDVLTYLGQGILTLLLERGMTLDSTSPVWGYSRMEDRSLHIMTRPIPTHSSGLRC